MKSELSSELLLKNNFSAKMELKLVQQITDLKRELACTAGKLNVSGEERFAKHIHIALAQLATALDETRWPNVLEFLTEIENVLLACKLGVNLTSDESIYENVQLARVQVKQLVLQKQFTPQ